MNAKQGKIIGLWFHLLLILFSFSLLFLWLLFFTLMIGGSALIEYMVITALCVINIAGLKMLTGKSRFGLVFPLVVSLILGTSSLIFGFFNPIPFAISAVLFLLTLVLLISTKSELRWGNMQGISGKQWMQLAGACCFIIVGGVGVGVYRNVEKGTGKQKDELNVALSTEDALEILDRTSVTLADIHFVEKLVKPLPDEYKRRASALKHILSGYIETNNRDFEKFRVVYGFRKDDLSAEQRSALDWLFKQQSDVKYIWQSSMTFNSIAESQDKIRAEMQKRNIEEL